MKPRVRFAPSPTGPLHIGGVRTALYNYLFAKKNNGTMILRIEDTDQQRFVSGAEEYIIESLDWLGIKFDEGVHVGGEFGPYRQSERKKIYKEYIQLLLQNGCAYYAFDSAEELEEIRKSYEKEKKNFQYDVHTRIQMNNSLTLDAKAVKQKIEQEEPYVIRFKHKENEEIVVNDLVRGKVVINSNLLDDKVLFKSDGMPTYHLANIVDDHLMDITHVIRGEEWLPSAPLHVKLYDAFGWTPPQFAHLPLLLKPEGNGKLSKRDGDRLGFPVFPLQWQDPISGEVSSGYRESGYLPEAVVNMLSLLGWNPGTTQEIMNMEELIQLFSLEKISKSGAKFDLDKAKWFNHHYMQQLSIEEFIPYFANLLLEKNIKVSEDYLLKVVEMVRERITFFHELWEQSYFFFVRPENYDEQVIKKRWKEDTPQRLSEIVTILQDIQPFDAAVAHEKVMQYISTNGYNTGQLMNCLRLSIVGAAKGPDLFKIIELLGVGEITQRVTLASQKIKML